MIFKPIIKMIISKKLFGKSIHHYYYRIKKTYAFLRRSTKNAFLILYLIPAKDLHSI